ncbi:MAG: protein kinase [Polyangiaceae bacterium]
MSARSSPSTRPYRTVGRYRVYSELASGGMATVHLGCLLGPGGFSKLVAIKCLHQEFAAETEFVSMFLDEARLASTIHHPNVVASLDVVAELGEVLVVMEYVHGETLSGLLRLSYQNDDLPSLPVITRIVCDALDGLHAAHVASLAGQCLNIVHRDVSPQNIMVGADGNTRMLDFGIAQAALRSGGTSAGTVKGKIAYMSPEQLQAQAVDARTDVFAMGVVLWEVLARRRLFFAADMREAAGLLLHAPIAKPSEFNAHLPPGMDEVVLKALARDVNQRYASAYDFGEALRSVLPEGSRREVAQWVKRVAADNLARRMQMLEALEASAIHTQIISIPPAAAASQPTTPPPTSDAAVATQLSAATSVSPRPLEASWRRRVPWIFASTGVVAALLAIAVSRPPERPAAHAASPPLLTAPLATTPPLVVPAAPSVVESKPAPAAEHTVEAAEAAAPNVVASSQPKPSPNPKKPVAVSAPPQSKAVAAPSKSCNPPYRIDAAGVRRVKPECL